MYQKTKKKLHGETRSPFWTPVCDLWRSKWRHDLNNECFFSNLIFRTHLTYRKIQKHVSFGLFYGNYRSPEMRLILQTKDKNIYFFLNSRNVIFIDVFMIFFFLSWRTLLTSITFPRLPFGCWSRAHNYSNSYFNFERALSSSLLKVCVQLAGTRRASIQELLLDPPEHPSLRPIGQNGKDNHVGASFCFWCWRCLVLVF